RSEHGAPGGGVAVLVWGWPLVLGRWLAGVAGRDSGWQRAVFARVQQASALQRKQEGEGWPDEQRGGDEYDDERDQGGLRGARVGQGERGAGQQYRVLGYAPAPDDAADPQPPHDPGHRRPARPPPAPP